MNFLTALGVAPWIVITAVVTWGGTIWGLREKRKLKAQEQDDRLEIHRDDLLLEMLRTAREEVSAAYDRTKSLSAEIANLRSFEQSYYHFLQSLDHIEAVLTADTAEIRKTAERSAQAFLKRMRRLNEAKGTIANEAQLTGSVISLAEQKITAISPDPLTPNKEIE